jgi:hypothetical protein
MIRAIGASFGHELMSLGTNANAWRRETDTTGTPAIMPDRGGFALQIFEGSLDSASGDVAEVELRFKHVGAKSGA